MRGHLKIFSLVSIFLFAAVINVSGEETKKEKINKTLKFGRGSGEKELSIDNVFGSVRVVGEKRDDVEMKAVRTTRARSGKKMEEAYEEVKLDIVEDENVISIYVDGPFRNKNGKCNWRGYRHTGYEVTYDFEVKVPSEVGLFLRTINDGEIFVDGVQGNFDVKNINGGIEMSGLAGSGKAYALNGEVDLRFDKNPKNSCYFGSLNGDVDIELREGFSADLTIKTFNGDVYSDFPVTYLPDVTVNKKKKGKKFYYKTSKKTRIRIGDGGPEIELDGFNGDMNLLKR